MENYCELAPDAVELIAVSDCSLRVKFANGEVRDFDARKQLFPRKCYASLQSPVMFETARIADGTIAWADGSDIDPEWLYEESVLVK